MGALREERRTAAARLIERMKAAGLVAVRPEDVEKPWAEQRLVLTPLGEAHERGLRRAHPEWFHDA